MRLLIWFPRRIKGVTEEEDVVEDEEDAEEDVEEDADEEGDVVVVEEVDLALRVAQGLFVFLKRIIII